MNFGTIRRRGRHGWRAAGLLCLSLLFGAGGAADAAPATEARSAAEIYERKGTVLACLRYVAQDLAGRAKARPDDGPAQLLLVVDPTPSLRDEMNGLRAALDAAWSSGPPGLCIGVFALGVDEYVAPSRDPTVAAGRLASMAFAPVGGARSVLAGVRKAAKHFAKVDAGPKALLLVTEDNADAEDDVEATREAIFDCDAAFYCIAGEAAFERAWVQNFQARDVPAQSLTERFNPMPKRIKSGAMYYGSEVAFGLIPYNWEFSLAQTTFRWVRPPNYPVPSGFGYWSLATLCHTSGGRYFVYDFSAPAMSPGRNRKRTTMFDFSRMSLFAPDLRPRRQVLASLAKNNQAKAIIRIWEHLANEAVPIVQESATLERRGGLVARPARAIRSTERPITWTWFMDMDEVRDALARAHLRVQALDKALKWWAADNGRERPPSEGVDPLRDRVEADFQLLGAQLRKVRFHWGEIVAALKTIKPLDVTYRRVRLRHIPIVQGTQMPRKGVTLDGGEREARFAALMLSLSTVARRYAKTPWALMLNKGGVVSFGKQVEVIERETPTSRRDRRDRDGDGKGKKGKDKPASPPRRPTPKPAPGPKPGSGAGGPVTGG